MTKRRTTTVTEEELADDVALEGWLLELGTDPEIQAVHVWKQNPRGGWTRLPEADLVPPFDASPTAVYERYGDGIYRFVGIGPRMKFRGGSRAVPVAGYGQGNSRAAPGPGSTSPTAASTGSLEAMREMVDQMRMEVQMASLTRMLERMNPPAPAGETPLSREERAVLHQEALDRDLDRVAKLKALMGGGEKPLDPVGLMREVLGVAKEVLGGAGGRGGGVATIKETLELLAVAKEALGGPAGDEGWTGIIRDLIRNPELLGRVREIVLEARVPPPARPMPRPGAPPPPAPRRIPPAAAPPPAPPVVGTPAARGADGGGPEVQDLPPEHPWEVLRVQVIPQLLEAAARGDREFMRYAELVDRLLPPGPGRPGALEEFTEYEFPVALERLAALDPRLREPAAAAWLQAFYTFVRDQFFVPEEEGAHGGAGGGATGGAAEAGGEQRG